MLNPCLLGQTLRNVRNDRGSNRHEHALRLAALRLCRAIIQLICAGFISEHTTAQTAFGPLFTIGNDKANIIKAH